MNNFPSVDAQDYLAGIMTCAPIITIATTCSPDRRVLAISDGISRLGYSPAEFLDKPRSYASIAHSEDAPVLTRHIATSLAEGRNSFSASYRLVDACGQSHRVEEYSSIIRDDEGAPLRLESCILDRNDSPQRQDDPDACVLALEKKIAMRERQLSEASIAADSAKRAKSTFLANMSHEFRTPLNGILGLSDLMLDSTLSPEQHEFMEMIKDAGNRLLDVLNSLIFISDMDLGRTYVHRQPFIPAQELASAIRPLSAKAAFKGLELNLHVSDNLPPILIGDIRLVEQILVHLVHNAIKFTPKGSIAVEISYAPSAHKPDSLEMIVAVTDTGIGIPKEKQDEIFEDFVIVEDYMNKSHSGAGLGLSISKRLIERMNGWIKIDSAPGHGSTFTFMIPFGLPDKEVMSCPLPAHPRIKRTLHKILVVEDDIINLRLLDAMLTYQGYEVAGASNGVEALEILNTGGFDLVLMDVQMPVMDGIEATKLIRTHDGSSFNPDIVIIALTAHAMLGDREKILSAGLDEYLPKPADWPAMRTILGKFFMVS